MTAILRVRAVGSGAAGSKQSLVQTYWRPGTSGGSTADATDVVARVRACLFAAVGAFSTSYNYRLLQEVDVIDDATGQLTGSFTGSAVAVVNGTATGDLLPSQTAYVIRAFTGVIVRGKLLKGRVFLAGATEGVNDVGGVPTAGPVSSLNSAFSGLLTGGSTASFPVIWSRPKGRFGVTALGTSDAVTGYSVRTDMWGSQRNRRAGA